MRPRIVVLAVVLLVAAACVGLVLSSRTAPASGLVAGRLRPCAERSGCVCSQDEGESHVAPLPLRGEPDGAFAKLVALLSERYTVLVSDDTYVHFQPSNWMGVRSDLEVLLDRQGRQVHVRSSARVGRGSREAHQRRVEALRAELADQ
ncbi:MAG: DUF1499 domain-containing protein [Planctomycetota bacterium]|nr:DUF1499 domain-containing protein [Planctomycetota bacterium]